MTVVQLKPPKASAIIYEKHCASYGFEPKTIFTLMELVTVDIFFDILVNLYEDHIEFMIYVKKTADPIIKQNSLISLASILEELEGVDTSSCENSYYVGEDVDQLILKCNYYGIHI